LHLQIITKHYQYLKILTNITNCLDMPTREVDDVSHVWKSPQMEDVIGNWQKLNNTNVPQTMACIGVGYGGPIHFLFQVYWMSGTHSAVLLNHPGCNCLSPNSRLIQLYFLTTQTVIFFYQIQFQFRCPS
jgi:hypothetical protein